VVVVDGDGRRWWVSGDGVLLVPCCAVRAVRRSSFVVVPLLVCLAVVLRASPPFLVSLR